MTFEFTCLPQRKNSLLCFESRQTQQFSVSSVCRDGGIAETFWLAKKESFECNTHVIISATARAALSSIRQITVMLDFSEIGAIHPGTN